MERIWEERQQQIDRVLAGRHLWRGARHVGSTLPPVPAPELDTVAGRLEAITAELS
jgi:hypothetical protein